MTLKLTSCEYAADHPALRPRPQYCPFENEIPDPCPACGATVSGDDPVSGVCQALSLSRPSNDPLVEIVLLNRHTGEVI